MPSSCSTQRSVYRLQGTVKPKKKKSSEAHLPCNVLRRSGRPSSRSAKSFLISAFAPSSSATSQARMTSIDYRLSAESSSSWIRNGQKDRVGKEWQNFEDVPVARIAQHRVSLTATQTLGPRSSRSAVVVFLQWPCQRRSLAPHILDATPQAEQSFHSHSRQTCPAVESGELSRQAVFAAARRGG